MKKVFVVLLALSAFGIVLSGCGSKDEAAAPAADKTAAPADAGK